MPSRRMALTERDVSHPLTDFGIFPGLTVVVHVVDLCVCVRVRDQ